MEPLVFFAVLLAALFHAGWNAVVKVGLDRFLTVTLIFLSAGFLSLCVVPFVPFPNAAAWPWLIASTLLHTGYKLFLVKSYDTGDMGQVYPIARGTAPLLVTPVMIFFFDEKLTSTAVGGMAMLLAGICMMTAQGNNPEGRPVQAGVGYALATAVFIAAYTITDGLGARECRSAHSYAVWLFLLDALLMLGVLLNRRGVDGLAAMKPFWRAGLAGGVMSLAAYWIILWAMTLAPIPLVAALRETSVLFGALISAFILRERLTIGRLAAAGIIVMGIVFIRMG